MRSDGDGVVEVDEFQGSNPFVSLVVGALSFLLCFMGLDVTDVAEVMMMMLCYNIYFCLVFLFTAQRTLERRYSLSIHVSRVREMGDWMKKSRKLLNGLRTR